MKRCYVALGSLCLLWAGTAAAQVTPLTDAQRAAIGGNFGPVVRGQITERQSLLQSEAGKGTIAGTTPAQAGAQPPGGGGPPGGGPRRGGGGPPPGPRGGITYRVSNDPRDLSGPWSAMMITGTGELLDGVKSRPGPQVVSPYEATRLCAGQSGLLESGFNILQRPEQITLLLPNNFTRVRRVLMNVPHPAQIVPRFAGNSVGHWEGNTLVIDTIGLKGALSRWRDPVSLAFTHLLMATPTLHVVERVRKLSPNQIEIISSYDDPATGMKPYRMRATYNFGALDPEIENICEAVGDLFGPGYVQGVLQ